MNIFNRLFGRKGKSQDGGETPEFKAFLAESMEGLQLQTSAHQSTWQFGKEERWDFSQDTGELVFTFPGKIVRAQAQIIGTFDSEAETWMWGWGNSSIPDRLTRDALQVREYGDQQGIHRLTAPTWPAEEFDCWHMTALACRLCSSNGAYRGPGGTTYVFFTLGEVAISKSI